MPSISDPLPERDDDRPEPNDRRWHMLMCLNHQQEMIELDFASIADWETWLRQYHPRIFQHWSSLTDPLVVQRGTGYYWSRLSYEPDRSSCDRGDS